MPPVENEAESSTLWRSRDGKIEHYKSFAVVTVMGVTYDVVSHPSLLTADHIALLIDDFDYNDEYKPAIHREDRHPVWLDLKKEWVKIKESLTNG